MKIKLDEGAYIPKGAHSADAGWNNCKCPICGKEFHLKPSKIRKDQNHYCSRECHREAKKSYMKGENNHQYGLKGDKNASWISDFKKSRYGYIQERVLDHPFKDHAGFVFQHRLIAEKHLLTPENSVCIDGKLYLSPEYEVHHKNFDRMDNSVSNLEVLTRKEHKAIHNSLNPNQRDSFGRFVSSEPETIKIKRVTKTAIMPQRQSEGAAGFDLYADISSEITVQPHKVERVYSGVAFEIPHNYFGAIYARSGLATKAGIRPATCVSVIDSDYRGNVGLPLFNDSDVPYVVRPQERVAQIVFQKALVVDLELVDELEDTERGDGGFGSSGR